MQAFQSNRSIISVFLAGRIITIADCEAIPLTRFSLPFEFQHQLHSALLVFDLEKRERNEMNPHGDLI